jgi:glucosamine--fructose-6-phosphate aminotransferase (isomerizing)
MCGIVGYVGSRPALDILIHGLERLEYRGYDSAGYALQYNHSLVIRKCVGRVSDLASLDPGDGVGATAGIAHTRWATHGEPSTENAHPHTDSSGRIALVHNGIIENYKSLKDRLEAMGEVSVSETDTEVLTKLIGREMKAGGNLLSAVKRSSPGSGAPTESQWSAPTSVHPGGRPYGSPLVGE